MVIRFNAVRTLIGFNFLWEDWPISFDWVTPFGRWHVLRFSLELNKYHRYKSGFRFGHPKLF